MSTRKNLLLKGHIMQRQRTASELSCAHHCLRRDGCLSFNYKLSSNTKGLCELSSGTAGRFDGGLSEGAGWIYGQIVRSKPIQAVEQNAKSGKNIQILNFYFTDFLLENGKRVQTDTIDVHLFSYFYVTHRELRRHHQHHHHHHHPYPSTSPSLITYTILYSSSSSSSSSSPT